MSDDYDDDEPGGLWDPDAIPVPATPVRPSLRVLPAPDVAERYASTVAPDASAEETLVRLDQFRPTADADADSRERHRHLSARHGLHVAAALVASAALGTGALKLSAGRDHTTTPPAATFLGPDAEQAALTRSVKPAGTGRHQSSAARRHSPHATAHSSAPASHGRQTPTRGTASGRPSRPSTVSGRLLAAAPSPRAPTSTAVRSAAASSVAPASASNAEFAFER
jgi:hypothetical protein